MASSLERPPATEYPSYFARYIDRVPAGDIVALLRENSAVLRATVSSLDESQGGYRYAPDKWTIRETLGHLIDVERIFVYRALRIGRGDRTPLPGFEQNDYALTAGSDARTVADLRDELLSLRDSTMRFFASLPTEAWTRVGTASGGAMSVRALAHIVVGHTMHHLAGLAERYGVPTVTGRAT